jgi:hypothetical protein
MERLQQQIEQLVIEACSHPPGSRERQINLTKIIRLVNRELWQENTSYYEDALQQTWIYFCQNLCEGKTGQPYDRDRASVITWLNNYLKRRLQDYYINAQKQQAKIINPSDRTDSLDKIEARSMASSLLEEVRKWVESDRHKKLRRLHIQARPEINCQVLILRRLPPPTSWRILAEEFNISPKTLSSFYQRQCLPLLREFGQSEGYL